MRPSTAFIGGVLAVLVGVLLVPVALSAPRPDDKSGQLGVGAVAVVTQAAHPSDRAGALGVGRVALESQPAFWNGERDYGLYTPMGAIAARTAVPVAVEEPSTTNWGAIALAAVVAMGVAVVAVALFVTTRRHHGPGRPVPH